MRCAPQGEQNLTGVNPHLLFNVLACPSSNQRHSSGDQRFRCPRPSSVSRAVWRLCATACMDRRCGTPGGVCLSFHPHVSVPEGAQTSACSTAFFSSAPSISAFFRRYTTSETGSRVSVRSLGRKRAVDRCFMKMYAFGNFDTYSVNLLHEGTKGERRCPVPLPVVEVSGFPLVSPCGVLLFVSCG